MSKNTSKNTKPQASDFVHLHNHTHYSLLDGLQKIPPMLERVKELGMEAIAVTDHGTLSGSIELYQQANKLDIKPIIGIETYVASRTHLDKDPSKDKHRYHLTVLAMNNQGYKNLMKLSTIAHLDGFYHKPRIDRDLLKQYNEGLIVLSGCINGEVGSALRNNQPKEAAAAAKWYKSVFGDRYYIELNDHGHQWKEQGEVNDKLLKLADKLGINAVVTADAHYLSESDQDAHEILLCVQTGSFLSDEGRMSLSDMDLFIKEPKEIIKRWEKRPDLITNTKAIADRCDVDIKLGENFLPQFTLPKGFKDDQVYLEDMVYKGLSWRYIEDVHRDNNLTPTEAKKQLPKEVVERAKFELGTISKMGFASYFLIVQDFINWGKQRDIIFGPGRGSAAGSIVAYALNVTDLDPLKYDLLFERFLNPERISMPDIDIDIQDDRRDEVIQYCVDKYGQDRVAHIVTFGTMAARNAIRDVARVMQVPYAEADRLAKLVPPPIQGRHIPLATSIVEDADLKQEYSTNADSKKVIDQAIKLEGTIRSHGVHAAGVVVAPDDIVNFTPLEMAQKGVVTTQYSMGPIEDLGLLKIDFLGLSNLTIIKNALRIVKKVDGKNIDLYEIPLDDKKTYELLGRGDTNGIFQFESSGMRRYLKELKPEEFDDLIAMGALYRPGPLTAGLTDRFIRRKNGLEPVSFDHPSLKSSLESTYGVMVYQEQVMRIAQDMCGFTGGQADTLRKAVGKKNRELLAKMKEDFVEGAIKTSGVSREFVEKFWAELQGFADYAFNKSHAASYGLISYWTAYLKTNYPSAFMAALMTSNYDDSEKLASEIAECRHMGLEVLPPDVNQSFPEFAVVPKTNKIRFGLSAIKNVGVGAVEEIVKARETGGPFKSIADFAKRVEGRLVNKRAWESLIKSGAFDELEKRELLLFNLDSIIAFVSKVQKEAASGQTDLFSNSKSKSSISHEINLEPAPNTLSERESLQWERELLGIYLSKHPLEEFASFFEEQLVQITSLNKQMDNKLVEIGGIIDSIKTVTTKRGAKMAFVVLADMTSELELIVFPNKFAENEDIWQQDAMIKITGKVNTKDRDGRSTDEIKVIVEEVQELDQETIKEYKTTGKKKKPPKVPSTSQSNTTAEATESKLFIHVKKPEKEEDLVELKKLLNKFPGASEAILVLGIKDKSAVKLPFKVSLSEELQSSLVEMFDKECVVVK